MYSFWLCFFSKISVPKSSNQNSQRSLWNRVSLIDWPWHGSSTRIYTDSSCGEGRVDGMTILSLLLPQTLVILRRDHECHVLFESSQMDNHTPRRYPQMVSMTLSTYPKATGVWKSSKKPLFIVLGIRGALTSRGAWPGRVVAVAGEGFWEWGWFWGVE